MPQSIWANPFKAGVDGTRDEVLEKYREWVRSQPDLMNQLHTLDDQVLGCWCAPQRCHGHVLIELREEQRRQQHLREGTVSEKKLEHPACAIQDVRNIRSGKIPERFRPDLPAVPVPTFPAELVARVIELEARGMLSRGECNGQAVLLDDEQDTGNERDAILASFAHDQELDAWLEWLQGQIHHLHLAPTAGASELVPDQAAPPVPSVPPDVSQNKGLKSEPYHRIKAIARLEILRSQRGDARLLRQQLRAMSDEEIVAQVERLEREQAVTAIERPEREQGLPARKNGHTPTPERLPRRRSQPTENPDQLTLF